MNHFRKYRSKRPNIQNAEQYIKYGFANGMDTDDYVSVEERRKRLIQLEVELDEKIKQHLPRSQNLELVILKCHLIVEFILDQYIDLMAPTEGVIESERFTFKQKVALVHMLGLHPNPTLFPSPDILNSIRNSIAHTLSLDRNKIDKLIHINSLGIESCIQNENRTDKQRVKALKDITYVICYNVFYTIKTVHEMQFYIDKNNENS